MMMEIGTVAVGVNAHRSKSVVVALITTLLLVASSAGAQAAAPVKLILTSHIGWEVDKTTKGNVCTVASKHECQPGGTSSKAGGFEFPEGVAAVPSGLSGENDVYVADQGNHRVQEFTAAGQFVSMFGRKVNKKGGDFCTAAEVGECQAGEQGATSDALAAPQSIAVDPATGNVYIIDYTNWRVAEYTPGGEFVLMVGKEVNATKDVIPGATEAQKNLCTAASKDVCQGGVQSSAESTEKGAFNFEAGRGDLLAFGGGTEHLLYVGDEQRVQEFNNKGEWVGEIKLPSAVTTTSPGGHISGLAVDRQTGVVYVDYAGEPIVHEYHTASGGELAAKIDVAPREGQPVDVLELALDRLGHLAMSVDEGNGFPRQQYGSLYEASDGHLLTAFTTPGFAEANAASGIAFNDQGELYLVLPQGKELWSYVSVPVAELETGNFTCTPEPVSEASSTTACTINGQVNPYKVSNTQAWFEWDIEANGRCVPSAQTGKQPVATEEKLISLKGEELKGLRPNGGFCYRLVGTDANSELPERLTGLVVSGRVPEAAPKVLGRPSASFVKASSVVMSGELNPENARTEYFFEYAAGAGTLAELCPKGVAEEACPGVSRTSALESEVYGSVKAAIEARNLQPSTEYHYRLVAKNEAAEAIGAEGTPFLTAPSSRSGGGGGGSGGGGGGSVVSAPVLASPPATVMLATPPIPFPGQEGGPPKLKCKRGFVRNAHKRCVKAKTKPKKSKKKGRKH